MGIADAAHEEITPGASHLVISKLACSLVGTSESITIRPGTRTYNAYGRIQSVEQFRCSYGLAPSYQQQIIAGALEVTAVGPDGEVRAIELRDHPFFVATLFLPQLSSSSGRSHPLIVAFLSAAAELTKP